MDPLEYHIQYGIEKAQNGTDLDHIRKEFERKNIKQEDVNVIMKQISNAMMYYDVRDSQKSQSNHMIYFGLFLTIISLIITIGTWSNMIDLGDVFIVAYGGIVSGISIIITHYRRNNNWQ